MECWCIYKVRSFTKPLKIWSMTMMCTCLKIWQKIMATFTHYTKNSEPNSKVKYKNGPFKIKNSLTSSTTRNITLLLTYDYEEWLTDMVIFKFINWIKVSIYCKFWSVLFIIKLVNYLNSVHIMEKFFKK